MGNAVPQSLEDFPLGGPGEAVSAADGILALLSDVLGRCEPADFAVSLWNGQTWKPGRGQKPRFTLKIRHPAAVRRLLVNPDLYTIGEAYIQGLFDVEGDLDAALEAAGQIMDRAPSFADRVRYALQTWRLLSARPPGAPAGFADQDIYGTLHRTRRAVNYHYDQPLEFWQQWLDRDLVYSCAYFRTGGETLDEAQQAKLDYVCRKLFLTAGERMLDIGCGWGALAIHAAKFHGVEVTGLTLSEKQADYARARIRAEGLQERCRIEVADFREWQSEEYDKISCIGMIEHVPQAFQHQFFGQVRELLRPGGLFLNQGVTCSAVVPSRGGSDFLDKYVFPDCQLVPVSTMLRIAEGAGLEVRDVENLREHYALTLREWCRRLEEKGPVLRDIVGETTYRIFRAYLCAAAADFRGGGLNLHQTLFGVPVEGELAVPLTRAGWYGDA